MVFNHTQASNVPATQQKWSTAKTTQQQQLQNNGLQSHSSQQRARDTAKMVNGEDYAAAAAAEQWSSITLKPATCPRHSKNGQRRRLRSSSSCRTMVFNHTQASNVPATQQKWSTAKTTQQQQLQNIQPVKTNLSHVQVPWCSYNRC